MWKIIVFAVGSLILIYVSRASLINTRSHGFYRFFAWEAIFALFLLNVEIWFHNPFSWYQIISWVLLIACIIPLIFGVRSLRAQGMPDKDKRPDAQLLAFERTTKLVTSGVYRYIRHPLYSSLLLLTWGIFFKDPSLPGELLAIAATLFLIITARMDERECLETFGADYQEYMKRTKMFIPYIF